MRMLEAMLSCFTVVVVYVFCDWVFAGWVFTAFVNKSCGFCRPDISVKALYQLKAAGCACCVHQLPSLLGGEEQMMDSFNIRHTAALDRVSMLSFCPQEFNPMVDTCRLDERGGEQPTLFLVKVIQYGACFFSFNVVVLCPVCFLVFLCNSLLS